MFCNNRDIGFKVISECDDCGIYQKGKIYRLKELIPEGHCYELLHSLLPYMVTFEHGGHFTWEREKDRICVSCPSVENNVSCELKKISEANGAFQYRILKVRGKCKFYEKDKVMKINKKDFNNLCWELFNVIYPYLRTKPRGINITCGASKRKGEFQLFK